MEMKSKKQSILIALWITLTILMLGALIYLLYDKYINENKVISSQISDVNKDTKVVVEKQEEIVDANDSIEINEYINKIYSYYESKMPEFTNINSAEDKWVWSVALLNYSTKYKILKYEISYNDVVETAKDLFGPNLTKKLAKTDMDIAEYYEDKDSFGIIGRGGPIIVPRYVISNIKKIDNGFEVKIIEYSKDISNAVGTEGPYEIDIYGNSKNVLKQFSSQQEKDIGKYVLANKDKFNAKQIILSQDKNTKEIYITSAKNI